jgi:DNA mismatch endonuclease (patch repair protein)
MTDIFSKEKRSDIMARIKSCDTKAELKVRMWLHKQGYRFRLHRKDLPGKPDIVLPKYKTIIFVNGCFWHRHVGCKRSTTPQSNKDMWQRKFERTLNRDKMNIIALDLLGWKVIVLWECEVDVDDFKKIDFILKGEQNNV